MRARKTIVYALCHMLTDFCCAYFMFSAVFNGGTWDMAALLYNFCGFALQMPLGLLADRLNQNWLVAAVGCVFVAVAFLMGGALIPASVILGLGNALFHVGGGVDILNVSGKTAGILGIFVSPGALGIYFGTVLGKSAILPWFLPVIFMIWSALLIALTCRGRGKSRGSSHNAPVSFPAVGEGAYFEAVLLFLVVCLRSYMGTIFSFSWKTGVWPLLFVCGVALGKAAGGFLSDWIGPLQASVVSLGASAVLFLFSNDAVCGTLAVFLFNMTMPITLSAVADVFPGAKGFSFGLLTFALFFGFAASWLGVAGFGSEIIYALGALVSLALLIPGVHYSERCQGSTLRGSHK